MPNYNAKNLINQKFGKLLVIEFSNIGKFRRTYWKCQCDCGNFVVLSSSALSSGNTKSCGCLVKEINSKEIGEAGLNKLFYTYQRGASKRKISFDLTLEEFKNITSLNCFYCGISPSTTVKNGAKWTSNGEYKYNGVDRLNSSLGYTKENCVPCCGTCNYAKRSMSYLEFKTWIGAVSDHMMSKNILFASMGKSTG